MVISGDVYGFWTMALALLRFYTLLPGSIQYRSEPGYVGAYNHPAWWEWWRWGFYARYTSTIHWVGCDPVEFCCFSKCLESRRCIIDPGVRDVCPRGRLVAGRPIWGQSRLETSRRPNTFAPTDQDNKTQLSLAKAKADSKTEWRIDDKKRTKILHHYIWLFWANSPFSRAEPKFPKFVVATLRQRLFSIKDGAKRSQCSQAMPKCLCSHWYQTLPPGFHPPQTLKMVSKLFQKGLKKA